MADDASDDANDEEPDVAPADGAAEDADDEVTDDAAEETAPVEMLFDVPVTTSRGQTVLHPDRDGYVALVERLRHAGYWMCVDLCGVDFLDHPAGRWLPSGVTAERFEVVVNLLNHLEHRRIRIRLQVPVDDTVVPTLSNLHPGVTNHERETFDLFGIRFDGHPDMSRILLPEDWDGHPLRKDDPSGRIPVQFKGAAS